LSLQESGKGRLPALLPLVIGQQLSGYLNITAPTYGGQATAFVQ
jgi:hypothetical protein